MRTRIAIAALATLAGCGKAASDPVERELDSAALAVLPALDAPLPAGKSAVWCASFQVAWNRLAKEVVKEPPRIRGAEEICRRLNGSAAGEGDLPEGSFYAAAGWVRDGIREKIRREMAAAFPSVPAPDLGADGTEAIAYAYLEAGVKFGIPFFESRKPLAFRDSAGRETPVTSFGIREEDDYAYPALRAQVEVLFAGPDRPFLLTEFAIDPCRTSSPVQIVLARVPPKESLRDTVAMVEEKIRAFPTEPHYRQISTSDVLVIPNMAFRVLHRFKELEGSDKSFQNPGVEAKWIGEALQSLRFRLDGSGAELQSEAKIEVPLSPNRYLFDRPFLVYLKKRNGGQPFFALWIDGAEVLQRWGR